MSASTILRASRTSRGITQRSLADAAKVRQPGVAAVESGAEDATVSRIEHLLAAMGSRLTVIPSRLRPVWAAGDDIRQALIDGDERSAWREVIQLNDDLRSADPATAVALAIAAPGPTGDARFDALIAAVTDCALTDSNLPLPTWIRGDAWALDQFWDVEDVPALRVAARGLTPEAISRHGIYLDRAVLKSV